MEDRELLLNRIVKGAEFIESLPKGDAKHKPAMQRYNSLCDDLMRMDGRS